MDKTKTAAVGASHNKFEDPLVHLPCSTSVCYGAGENIYGQKQGSAGLYLVIDGRVKIVRIAGSGRQMLVGICQPEEFFGESAFLRKPSFSDQATALEPATIMSWGIDEVEGLIVKRPRLGIALLQMQAQRALDQALRLESLVNDSAERRLARCLISLSERLGKDLNGSMLMLPLTHELLSQYIGTSREVISTFMSRFRRMGYVTYSRMGIEVWPEQLKQWLRKKAV